MNKYFNTFDEFLRDKDNCPVCHKKLIFEIIINTDIRDLSHIFDNLKFVSLEDNIDQDVKVRKYKKEVKLSKIGNKVFFFKEPKVKINLKKNQGTFKNKQDVDMGYDFKIYCPHDLLKTEYLAYGYFAFDSDQFNENNKTLSTTTICLDYEIFKLMRVDLKNNWGSRSIITNDYTINKTSFSIVNINLKTQQSTFNEKRVDLVDTDFFKFDNPRQIHTRINNLFIL